MDHRTHLKRGIVVFVLFLGNALFLSCCFNVSPGRLTKKQVERTQSILGLLGKNQTRDDIADAVHRSPVIMLFGILNSYCSHDPFMKDSLCTNSQEKPLNAFIVDGSPTQVMLDFLSQITTMCIENPDRSVCHPPQDEALHRNDFPFLVNQIKALQKDLDLITVLQHQKDFCSQHPQEGKFCKDLYPLDSQPIKKINKENIYPDLLNL